MSNYKILIVDDEELNIELMIDTLEDEDYQIETAADGAEAVEKFKQFNPDMVLLDVMMPVMNGYDACSAIRNLEKDSESEIPIIFISAKANLEDKILGYEVGGNEYITKPFDNSELLAKVGLAFKQVEQVKKLQQSVNHANALAFDLMTTSSKIGLIGQFLRHTLTCTSFDSLLKGFFRLTQEEKLGCTVKAVFNGETIILSDDGIERPIDFEIINNYTSSERIFYFGKSRALFNWGNITMLVRNVGDEADNIAIMLDGMEAGIKFMEMQSLLLTAVHSFKEQNTQFKSKAATVLENMEEELRMNFCELGASTNLTEEEEENLTAIVEQNRTILDEVFLNSRHLEENLSQAISSYQNRR
ncbi:response regulator [Thalassomonas viridans]|uniref:Response regulator n=1 Tax=Thalassomonas viridans TaxID=137584 RepID=A0AAF0CB34_9GAMM|nr:response regulator [Thalassomonas viridans]WDE07186.1 response regulator [Thalassomonas viridans]